MNPQPARQLDLPQAIHGSPLAALLQKPHVPSKLPRFTPPAPKKRKWKMVWVENVTYTEINICAVCGDRYCCHPERSIKKEKHVSRSRKRQYID